MSISSTNGYNSDHHKVSQSLIFTLTLLSSVMLHSWLLTFDKLPVSKPKQEAFTPVVLGIKSFSQTSTLVSQPQISSAQIEVKKTFLKPKAPVPAKLKRLKRKPKRRIRTPPVLKKAEHQRLAKVKEIPVLEKYEPLATTLFNQNSIEVQSPINKTVVPAVLKMEKIKEQRGQQQPEASLKTNVGSDQMASARVLDDALKIKKNKELISQYLAQVEVNRYYPKSAIRRSLEGTTEVKLTFSGSGKLEQVVLFQQSEHGLLDKAALRLVKEHQEGIEQAIVSPAMNFNEVRYSVIAPIRFQLNL